MNAGIGSQLNRKVEERDVLQWGPAVNAGIGRVNQLVDRARPTALQGGPAVSAGIGTSQIRAAMLITALLQWGPAVNAGIGRVDVRRGPGVP